MCFTIFAFDSDFSLFSTCARLLILQPFKMDSSEGSEVEVSSQDGEGEFKTMSIDVEAIIEKSDISLIGSVILNINVPE